MIETKFKTREEWLQAAVELMTPAFVGNGYEVPTVHVACGWPSVKALSEKGRRIGECWDKKASSDGIAQIFISPWLSDIIGLQGILSTLVHEVVHAVVGNKEKHNKVFGKCARAIGLEGKLTSTVAGENLITRMTIWAETLGEYPHGKLDMIKDDDKKKQTTRMIKMECRAEDCGYVARTAKKWLDAMGPCHCPKHGLMFVDAPAETDDEETEDSPEEHGTKIAKATLILARMDAGEVFVDWDKEELRRAIVNAKKKSYV